VTMRASVVVVGRISRVGVECKWSVVINSGDMSMFDFGCRSLINLSLSIGSFYILTFATSFLLNNCSPQSMPSLALALKRFNKQTSNPLTAVL
jgi:hypothetical protein